MTYGNLALKDDPAWQEATLQCPIRFQGQWEDYETGLYYNRFRHYDPLIGQYITADPMGLWGGTRVHGYVHNSNTWIDPLGLANLGYDFPTFSGIYHISAYDSNIGQWVSYVGSAENIAVRLSKAEHTSAQLLLSMDNVRVQYEPVNLDGLTGVDRKHALEVAETQYMKENGVVPNSKTSLNTQYPLSDEKLEKYGDELDVENRRKGTLQCCTRTKVK